MQPDFRAALNDDISDSFRESRCNAWQTTNVEWLHEYLRTFRTKDNKLTPPEVINFYQKMEEYQWDTGKDHISSGIKRDKLNGTNGADSKFCADVR